LKEKKVEDGKGRGEGLGGRYGLMVKEEKGRKRMRKDKGDPEAGSKAVINNLGANICTTEDLGLPSSGASGTSCSRTLVSINYRHE